MDSLFDFLLHWGIMSLSLWIASHVFRGLSFSSRSALLVSALVLGFVNAVLRPILILLTFPLTLLTLGLFILVINALMIMLVASLVQGSRFRGSGQRFLSVFSLRFARL